MPPKHLSPPSQQEAQDTPATMVRDISNAAGEFDFVVKLIYVGKGGKLVLIDSRGNTATHENVPDGAYIGPGIFTGIGPGTNASSLVAYSV